MKNMRWLRSVAFLLLLTIAVTGVLQCYGLPATYNTNSLATFDAEEENMIDGIAIGTSVIAYAWNTPAAWEKYGLTIYQLATSVQPFGAIPEYLNYARKKQDIRYCVIDVHGLRKDAVFESLRTGYFRIAYLDVPDIPSRIKILNSLFDYAEAAYDYYGKPEDTSRYVDLDNKAPYYFPFLNFHDRWMEGLKKSDFRTGYNKYLGANDRGLTFNTRDCSHLTENWKYEPLEDIDDFQKEQLNRIFEYGKENNVEFLFVSLPSFHAKEVHQELGALLDYCKKNGYNTIDFATEEIVKDAELDLSQDVLNSGHLNSKGGIKITSYICKYLINHGYYTPDHRGDERYEHWNTATKDYLKFYKYGWFIKMRESKK